MPKVPINYQKIIIYKIVSNDLNITDTYVGSTTDFVRRKYEHKNRCINEKSKSHHLKVYKFIRENGGFSNWSMIEIEKYPCNDVNEATKRERFFIEQLNSTLNFVLPQRTYKEWRITFKEEIALRKKVYLEKNKEEIAIKCKEYREKNKEELAIKHKEYHEKNKEEIIKKNNEYRKKNKEEIVIKKKEWREKNKEKIQEKRKETFLCDCGENLSIDHKLRHLKTQKHKKLILGKDIVL
jgi:hypothetical protein